MKANAFTVKSYNQPRRDQRQQVLQAARELEMMVAEGGSTFMHNAAMINDGHTGIEHTLPVQTAYDDVMDLWRNTGVGSTSMLPLAEFPVNSTGTKLMICGYIETQTFILRMCSIPDHGGGRNLLMGITTT